MNEEKKEVRVPRLDELDALAMELSEEYKVYADLEKTYYVHSKPEVAFIVSLTGDNKLGSKVKEKVERFLGVKLKAKPEVLAKGMIEFRYEIPGKLMVRLDKAMTCKKVGTEKREVEYKVEVEPGKEPVMETKKKMAEVPVYKCTEADIEFRGKPE